MGTVPVTRVPGRRHGAVTVPVPRILAAVQRLVSPGHAPVRRANPVAPALSIVAFTAPKTAHTCGLRLPGLAASVPADEAEVGDLRRHLLEVRAVDVAVRSELGHALALPGHRHAHAPHLVRRPGLGAECEFAVLDEEDPRPPAAAPAGKLGNRLTEYVVGVSRHRASLCSR